MLSLNSNFPPHFLSISYHFISLYQYRNNKPSNECGLRYLAPKRRVDRLSEALEGLGEQQHSNAVREFPPCKMRNTWFSIKIDNQDSGLGPEDGTPTRASCRIRVSLESRYGMWFALPCGLQVKAFITFPSAERDLLIVLASSRSFPSAPVFSTFSDPAKSTRINFPVLILSQSQNVLSFLVHISKTKLGGKRTSYL